MTKRKPFRFFWEDPFSNMDKMMKGMFGESSVPINLKDEGEALVLYADLPGFKKEEIDLDVRKDLVKLEASKKEKTEDKSENYYRKEFSRSTLSRSISLPELVKPSETKAKLDDGVLRVEMPKQKPTEEKKSTKIDIE